MYILWFSELLTYRPSAAWASGNPNLTGDCVQTWTAYPLKSNWSAAPPSHRTEDAKVKTGCWQTSSKRRKKTSSFKVGLRQITGKHGWLSWLHDSQIISGGSCENQLSPQKPGPLENPIHKKNILLIHNLTTNNSSLSVDSSNSLSLSTAVSFNLDYWLVTCCFGSWRLNSMIVNRLQTYTGKNKDF